MGKGTRSRNARAGDIIADPAKFSKKNNVDKAVIEFITRTFVSKNILLSFLTKILIDLVPRITQSLYEIIMSKAGEQC